MVKSEPGKWYKLDGNWYKTPFSLINKIRDRDIKCVYCKCQMHAHIHSPGTPKDKATVEHMDDDAVKNPEEWNVAICCGSCNSSHKMPLKDWFKTNHCIDRKINESTVAPVIQEYMKRCPDVPDNYGKRKKA